MSLVPVTGSISAVPRKIRIPGRAIFTSGFVVFTALFLLIAVPQAWAITEMDGLSGLEVVNPSPQVLSQAEGTWSSSTAWTSLEASTHQGWSGTFDAAAGLPQRGIPSLYDAAVEAGVVDQAMDAAAREAALDASQVDRMSRSFYSVLRASYANLPQEADLRYLAVEKRGGVWWASYEQTLEGIRVEGTRADFRFSSDGHLVYFDLSLVPASIPVATAVLDAAAADRAAMEALARGGLSLSVMSPAAPQAQIQSARQDRDAWVAETPSRATSLVYFRKVSADGRSLEVRPAWITRTEVTDPPARFASRIDAVTGEVLARENEIYYANILGHSDGDVQFVQPSDPYVNRDFPDLRVTVSGVGDAFTGPTGNYSIASPDALPHFVTSRLTGHYASIQDALGTPPQVTGLATPNVPFPIHWSDSNSDGAERDVYYHVNVEHSYIKAIEPGFTGTDFEMTANVNLNQTCNAFWDGTAVNFFRAGGGCTNTGQIPDVIYHEYGHAVSQFVYAPASPSGGEHEGFSDYIAASMTDQPIIGRGFYGPGTQLRTCDNDRQWPASECGGEPHCEGEVIAGALWHMRQNLVARLGHAPGVTLSDHLFHFARYGRQSTYEGFYFDVLALDDNNGTLVDGTPHAAQIIQAFDRHNIGPGWTLEVLHSPHQDTEDAGVPIPIVAVFSSPADLRTDSLATYYSTTPIAGGPTNGPHRLGMIATANIREYRATIPPQPLGTRVRYYISGYADTLGMHATSPAGAPGVQHEFRIETDSTAPVVAHIALTNKSAAIWPVQIPASVTDNQAVALVQVEWKRNGADQPAFALPRIGASNDFLGTFDAAVAEGDHILYRVKAIDTAHTPNVAYLPTTGYLAFDIVHAMAEDVEHGAQDLSHAVVTLGFNDQWHLSTQRNHTPGGSTSWKFGDTGNGVYLDSSDGALLTPPVHLGPVATLSFWHWISAEDEGSGAWDGAVVEITTNGGTTWSELVPAGGYTHTIISNPASPFTPGYPCWSGFFDWRQANFNLSSFAGQTAQIRFRFGSDGAVTYEGWYIDDLLLNPGADPAGVEEVDGSEAIPTHSGLLSVAPNPFNPHTKISFAVSAGTPGTSVKLEILDVSGRRVRTLADGAIAPGIHTLTWNGRGDTGDEVGSGVYFARLRVGEEESSLKLSLLK